MIGRTVSRPRGAGEAIDRVAALRTQLVGPDLADALENLDRHALLCETGEVCGAQPIASAI